MKSTPHLTLALFVFATVAASASISFTKLPEALPKVPPPVAVIDGCSDRKAALNLLSRLKASRGADDAAFHKHDEGEKHYVAFRPKDVEMSFAEISSCFPLYMGTESEARKIGLWVPGLDAPSGSIIFTPSIGFYGDPRAWRPTGTR